MPEGVRSYPRFDGALRARPAFGVIAMQEARRARLNLWSQYAFILIVAYTVVYLGTLYQASQRSGDLVHTMDNFLGFVNLLPWGALAVASVMTGPALLEDARHGALELYLSRAVTRADYLAGLSLIHI